MDVFELRLAGFILVRETDLKNSTTGVKTLAEYWREYLIDVGDQQPVNQFSPDFQQYLQKHGYVDHSEFYQQTKIAGFYVNRGPNFKKEVGHVFIFVIPGAGEVRSAEVF